ncbi:DUF427 domain-containing protein [Massilia sp. 9096]|uniref:DUF427 domain-containing protein n=1 Tax=Massilia sp. 9096 TaxID=1500894 RepID=UPI00056B354E|nr:DUF427 domain-containing protein [Massilia sp. 9096]
MDKIVKVPGPDHPIAVMPSAKRVMVTLGETVVADTRHALSLKEAAYPAVLYIPRADVQMDLLIRSQHTTYCPYKGDCNYFSIPSAGARGENAVWTYEHPHDAVAPIANHLAFYPDRVDVTTVD